MTKEKKQGDNLFNILRLVKEHNDEYGTTLNLVEIDKEEYDKS